LFADRVGAYPVEYVDPATEETYLAMTLDNKTKMFKLFIPIQTFYKPVRSLVEWDVSVPYNKLNTYLYPLDMFAIRYKDSTEYTQDLVSYKEMELDESGKEQVKKIMVAGAISAQKSDHV